MKTRAKTARKSAFALACLSLLSLAACLGAGAPGAGAAEACPNEAIRTDQHATYLPDCRAYELVSPAEKGGAGAMAYTNRFRVSTAPETPSLPRAAVFGSLGGFADARGSGVSFEYMAQRSAEPGTQGWSTHAITPAGEPMSYESILTANDPLYVGDGDASLTKMVFQSSWDSLASGNALGFSNLYLRSDLRDAGPGAYQLLTQPAAPMTPLPVSQQNLPLIAGASADLSHVLIESLYPLTADAPANGKPKLYESVNGALRLVGILPASEGGGPAPTSVAGQNAGAVIGGTLRTPHVISADGSRVFFEVPTSLKAGALYMRDDQGTTTTADDTTVRLTTPEGALPDSQEGDYWDAAADGSRVFFTTGTRYSGQLYMYDASKPASDPHNLTLLSADENNEDPPRPVYGVLGVSRSGDTVYFLQRGQIVAGQPALGETTGIYAWREGQGVSYVGALPVTDDVFADLGGGDDSVLDQLGARVSPDGRFLLFSARQPPWPGGADHGNCNDFMPGCAELYLYDAASGAHPVCVSCTPDGSPPTTPSFFEARIGNGGSGTSAHLNEPLAPDGSRVYFTSGEALLPQDTNGKTDAYEWRRAGNPGCPVEEADGGCLSLLSSGTSPSDSYFLEATPDGSDVFIATSQRLNGWDTDGVRDVYDVREGGGFPDPPATAAPCSGEEPCRGAAPAAPGASTPSSRLHEGPGNLSSAPCPKGKVRRHGACVKPHHHHHRHHHKRHRAGAGRRAGR